MDSRIEKAELALKDADFVQKLLSLEEPEDVQKLYAEKGVDLTLDEVKLMGAMLSSEDGDEVSDEQLDSVAGGIALTTVTAIIGGVAVLIDIGTYHKQKYGKW